MDERFHTWVHAHPTPNCDSNPKPCKSPASNHTTSHICVAAIKRCVTKNALKTVTESAHTINSPRAMCKIFSDVKSLYGENPSSQKNRYIPHALLLHKQARRVIRDR